MEITNEFNTENKRYVDYVLIKPMCLSPYSARKLHIQYFMLFMILPVHFS